MPGRCTSYASRTPRSIRARPLTTFRGEDAQAVLVRIQRHEGVAEIQLHRCLRDRQPALAQVRVELVDPRLAFDRKAHFMTATRTFGRGLYRVTGPESEHEARVEREHGEGRGRLDRFAA